MSPRNVSVSQVFSAPASIPVLLAHGNLTLRVVTTVEEEVRAGVGNLWRRLVLPKRIDCWSLTSHPTTRRAGDKKIACGLILWSSARIRSPVSTVASPSQCPG